LSSANLIRSISKWRLSGEPNRLSRATGTWLVCRAASEVRQRPVMPLIALISS
jgi:hypothetical protein